jgi:hypothetical protein
MGVDEADARTERAQAAERDAVLREHAARGGAGPLVMGSERMQVGAGGAKRGGLRRAPILR